MQLSCLNLTPSGHHNPDYNLPVKIKTFEQKQNKKNECEKPFCNKTICSRKIIVLVPHYITNITTLLTYYLKLHGPASSAILPSLTVVYLGNKSLYCNCLMWSRESKTVLDSGFHAVDSGTFFSENWFLQCWFQPFDLYFRFQSSEFRIPQQKWPNSGFYKQKCPGLQNLLHGVIIKNNQWEQGIMTWSSYSVCFQHHGNLSLLPFYIWEKPFEKVGTGG